MNHWIWIFCSHTKKEEKEFYEWIDKFFWKKDDKNILFMNSIHNILFIDKEGKCFYEQDKKFLPCKNWIKCIKEFYDKYDGYTKNIYYSGHSDDFVLGNYRHHWKTHVEFSNGLKSL